MTPLVLAAALSLIAASDASQSVQVNSPPNKEAEKPKDDPDRVVCRTEPQIGTHFNKRICMTKAQWDQAAEQSQKSMNEIREHTGLGMGAGGGFSGH